jgi:hypothetical protein
MIVTTTKTTQGNNNTGRTTSTFKTCTTCTVKLITFELVQYSHNRLKSILILG